MTIFRPGQVETLEWLVEGSSINIGIDCNPGEAVSRWREIDELLSDVFLLLTLLMHLLLRLFIDSLYAVEHFCRFLRVFREINHLAAGLTELL